MWRILCLTSSKGVIWTMAGIAILLSFGRWAIRYTVRKRFFWDDFTHLLALLTMIAYVGVAQSSNTVEYRVNAIENGQVQTPPPEVLEALLSLYRNLQLAESLLIWTELWLIKLTFMLFYRLLFEVSSTFMTLWWSMLIFLFVTYWIPIAGALTLCGTPWNFLNNPGQFIPLLLHNANMKLIVNNSGLHISICALLATKSLGNELCGQCSDRPDE